MITAIQLEHYRNFAKFSTELAKTTLITGKNGIGKSNLLEAIAFFGGYRATKVLKEMIAWDSKYARIGLESDNHTHNELRAVIQSKSVRLFTGEKSLVLSDIFSQTPVVFFSPRVVTLLEDVPSERRKVIDLLLSQISAEYHESFKVYMRVLRQRNAALKHGETSQQSVWESSLAKHGAHILLSRNWLLRELAAKMRENDMLVYVMSPRSGEPLLPKQGTLDENIYEAKSTLEQFLVEKWKGLREKELQVGFTLMGPQRDDWTMHTDVYEGNIVDVATYGSRGQQRVGVITLQHAMLSLLEEHLDNKPLWILDDVFSELDSENQAQLKPVISNYQTFISSANERDEGIQNLYTIADVKHIPLDTIKAN